MASCHRSPTSPPKPCGYVLASTTTAFGAGAGSGLVQVDTTSECGWLVSTKATWITVQETRGLGSGATHFSVAANTGSARAGILAVGTESITITQEARACTYDVSTQSQSFAAIGGTGTLAVTTPAGCGWTAQPTASWITITSGASGEGSAPIVYTVAAHSGAGARTAGITIDGFTITIHQSGVEAPSPEPSPVPADCSYQVAPTELALHWHGISGEVAITTAGGCPWSVDSTESWLAIESAASASGPGRIRFLTGPYTLESTRRATLRVRWPTITAGQNVIVTQEGCRYGLSATQQFAGVAGGTSNVLVLGDPVSVNCMIGCPWTAVPDVSWIHVTSSMPRAGDDPFFYQVDANPTGQVRTGHIRIETAQVTVIQAGQ